MNVKRLLLSTILFSFCITLLAFAEPFLVDDHNWNNTADGLLIALPTLSYTSPHTYSSGAAITPLKPSSTSVAAPGYGNPAAFATGFTLPSDMVIDLAGDVYVIDAGTLKKVPAGGDRPVNIAVAKDVAIDATGNLYLIDGKKIKKIRAGGGPAITLSPTFINPLGLAVDAAGNVYVSDAGNNSIRKIPVGGGRLVTLGSGFNDPVDIAADAAGNIYVADFNNSKVKRIPAGGGAPVTLASGFRPYAVTLDAANNVYISDADHGKIKKIAAFGGAAVSFAHVGNSHGITVDDAGVVYVSDQQTKQVDKIKPVGGYYLSRPLPLGLSFSTSTGTISGTPTAVSPATNYLVTAYNGSGGKSATVNITVSPPTPPTISYTTPQKYITGTAIVHLNPTNDNVATYNYNNSAVNIAAGLGTLQGMTIDKAGNIYVGDFTHNLVKKIPAGGGPVVNIGGSDFSAINDVDVDAKGNIYVADNDVVKKIPAGGGPPVTLGGSGFTNPLAVAVDSKGNVYVADNDFVQTSLKKIPAGGDIPFIVDYFTSISELAVDAEDNLYIADLGQDGIIKLPSNGALAVVLHPEIGPTSFITIDAVGNLYVARDGSDPDLILPANGGSPIKVGPGFVEAASLAVDSVGNEYRVDQSANSVKKIKPSGGYYLSRALPVGLIFSNITGIISGTPIEASPSTNYTVTAYNGLVSKSTTVNITVNPANVPAISYNSPQVYTTRTAIPLLKPIGSGVSSAGYTTRPANIASGFNEPIDVATDAAGNIYVADYANGKVKKIPAGGGAPITIASGLGAIGITADAVGNVYVTDLNNNKVKKIPAGGGIPITIASGFLLGSIAVDSTGNVYYISGGDGSLTKIPKNGGSLVKILSGHFELGGMTVDGSGNIYVVNGSNSAIEKIAAGGGKPVIIASGFSQPGSLAIDAAGNLYVTDGGDGIKKIVADSKVAVTISPIYDAGGLAVDAKGNVYTAEFINNTVRKIKPIGGYYLSRPLPVGLNFSTADGTISGTPTSPSPATNYVISAYNSGGGKSDVINITVLSSNANLSNIKLSSGTLSPAFVSGTTNYSASVSNATTSIKVTPTASSPFATIKVNSALTISGTASASIPLSVGVNTITTVVNAQSGTNRIYTVKITRRAPGSLDPEDFNPSADSLMTADDGVIVHQAVSPNGDGVNDVLLVDKIDAYPDNELTIINASGVKIFDIKGYDNGSRVFDGHSNLTGVMQQAGTYFYSIDYNVNGINKHKTGYFVIKY